MARIVKLSELLPEDFIFELSPKQRFTMPGDPPLQLILRIAELFERSQDAGDEEGVGLEVLGELDAQMLALLQMRDENITSSPFGVLGVQHVVGALLRAYNFGEVEPDEADPPKPASKSKRSNGSPSSSTSSASRRTTTSGSAGRRSKPSSA